MMHLLKLLLPIVCFFWRGWGLDFEGEHKNCSGAGKKYLISRTQNLLEQPGQFENVSSLELLSSCLISEEQIKMPPDVPTSEHCGQPWQPKM